MNLRGKKINREILALALPNILSNVSVPLISSVDTSLMGRTSELHLGAIGLGAMIFNFLYWNFGFLRMGTTGMTSQSYGRENVEEICELLAKSVFIAAILGMALILFQGPILSLAEGLLNVPAEHKDLVSEYFRIRIYAAPASLILYSVLGWFFGMQNAIYPLLVTLLINLSNILLSYILVMHFGMGIRGVAIGTVMAQYLGLALALGLILYRYKEYFNALSLQMIRHMQTYKQFFLINRDIFLRTVMLSTVFGMFYAQSAQENAIILAVNVVLLQFLNWMSYIIDGYAFAAEALVGKYLGAKDSKSLVKTVNLSMLWGLAMAILFSIMYAVLGEDLMRIFTLEQEVIAASGPFLWWMIILPIFGFACYIWDGVFIGLTASVEMRNSMFFAFIVFVGLLYLGRATWNSQYLWIALISFLAVRGLVQTIYYRGKIKQKIKVKIGSG